MRVVILDRADLPLKNDDEVHKLLFWHLDRRRSGSNRGRIVLLNVGIAVDLRARHLKLPFAVLELVLEVDEALAGGRVILQIFCVQLVEVHH